MTHDLIDRYMAAVARELPERERDDIAAELRDELMSGVEAREEVLGRPLTSAELESALAEFGNPLVVAGRYRKVQHLIGPQVFPFWWAAMRATLMVIGAVYVVLIVLGLATSGRLVWLGAPSPLFVLGFAFGAVTLACALVERFGDPAKMARWRPARLPPATGKRPSRFELLTELGMGVVFLLWWVGAIRFRDLAGEMGLQIELAAVWRTFFWWIVVYSLIEIAANVIALLRPDQGALNRWMVIWRSLFGAAILLAVIQAEQLLLVGGSSGKSSALLNLGLRATLAVGIAALLARVAVEGWRLRQDDLGQRAAA